jgi:hypothetical protein
MPQVYEAPLTDSKGQLIPIPDDVLATWSPETVASYRRVADAWSEVAKLEAHSAACSAELVDVCRQQREAEQRGKAAPKITHLMLVREMARGNR